MKRGTGKNFDGGPNQSSAQDFKAWVRRKENYEAHSVERLYRIRCHRYICRREAIQITRLVPNVFARSSGFYLCGHTRLREETARLCHAVLVEGRACEQSVAHRKNRLRLIVSCCDSCCCAATRGLIGLGRVRMVGRFAINVRKAISQCRIRRRGRTSIAEEREL